MKRLTPEEKVQITANMSDAIIHVSLEGIKARYSGFSEKETVELLRERIKKRRR